ncbi:MAG: sodium/solute symporter [Bacteroidota bacterium]
MADFGTLNWTILIIYVSLNLVLGIVLSKNVKTADDFYVGRRTTPWWAIGISVFATYVSALTFLGAPAWSYNTSFSVVALHINYPIVIFVVISFFLPFFFNSGVASIYDYQEKRFGEKSRIVISAIFLLTRLLITAAILYGTSLVIAYITGMNVVVAIVVVTIIALIYTLLGGITAVIWTDVLQTIILMTGVGIIVYALFTEMPNSMMETLAQLKAQGKLNAIDLSVDFTKEATIWAGIIGMTLFHITVYGADQMMVQRVLASKNIGDAKKSFLVMGFAAFLIYFLFLLLGVLFYAYYNGKPFENSNLIILEFVNEYNLPGLMGIIVAAIVAASMSSLDSFFNSMATIATVDFYEKYFRTNESPEHYLTATRWFTVIWAVIIMIPAIIYTQTDASILKLISEIGAYFVGAKLAMFGLGFFSKHTTEKGLLLGVLGGLISVIIISKTTAIAWPWFCLIGGAINIAIAIPASILLDGYQKEWSLYTVKGQKALFEREGRQEKENGWYLVPGKIDQISYVLLAFFVFSLVALWSFEHWI